MAQYNSSQPNTTQKHTSKSNPFSTMIAAFILGIFILIAAINIKSGLNSLAKAITAQKFSSEFSSPSTITVNDTADKKYLTQEEAAEYLNITTTEISTAISNNEISDYIITSDGYSIPISALDDFFENKSYEIQIKNNTDE